MKGFWSVQVNDISVNINTYRNVHYCNKKYIFQISGKKWHARRKIITPAFHFKILEEFVEVYDRLGHKLIDEVLSKYTPESNVNFFQITGLYALDVMCGKFKIFINRSWVREGGLFIVYMIVFGPSLWYDMINALVL